MDNSTIFQFFHWYYQDQKLLWHKCRDEAKTLKEHGLNYIWLPPAYKGSTGASSVGYDVYDLFDLGEFDQKGSVATKYGTKTDYLDAIESLKKEDIKLIVDVVLNHRLGGDEKESMRAYKISRSNRDKRLSDPIDIEAYTRFVFPGRANKYSSFIWDQHCFSAIEHAENISDEVIYKIINEYGKDWPDDVSDEKGNFDYLLGADVEFRNPKVRDELKYWLKWYLNLTQADGFRFDAVKHMHAAFINELLTYLEELRSPGLINIGEYWTQDLDKQKNYLQTVKGRMQLFDSILHYHFNEASQKAEAYDLRKIFDGSLTSAVPSSSISFVENHDTQPMQSLESPVSDWFKPIAYALILLRQEALPCVFYPDFYGASYHENDQDIVINAVKELPALLKARNTHAYGEQVDYFDNPNNIGWVRLGDEGNGRPGCAVVASNKAGGKIRMKVHERHARKKFKNVLNEGQQTETDDDSWADFYVEGKAVAIWIPA